jgi:hypothetical protein
VYLMMLWSTAVKQPLSKHLRFFSIEIVIGSRFHVFIQLV